ncbi:hypothetical protein ACM55R_23180 [Enterobacter hormaechei]|uniref:hypothetical protein n=1 Tax=Enterobacter hormaechei TaxID=158836 RepID=UPI0039FC3BA3|nr:hypothetical protein [Escherichia coli]
MAKIIMESAAGRISDFLFIFIGCSKTVASVFARLFFFMAWFPVLVYGFYRIAVILWGGASEFESEYYYLGRFFNYTIDLYSLIIPMLVVVGVSIIVIFSLFKIGTIMWEEKKR